MSDQGFFELVLEDGQLIKRGFPMRSQISPSSNIGNFENGGDAFPPNRAEFLNSDSIIDDSHYHDKKDFYPNFTRNTTSLQDYKQRESLLELGKSHFKEFSEQNGGNISYDRKLHKETQVVPVHETAPTGNSQAHQFSLQQQHQVSNPFKRPRLKPSPNLFSLDVPPNSNTLRNHRDLETERKKETVNFSLFLTSPAVTVSSSAISFSRGEKLQNNCKTYGHGSENPFPQVPTPTVNGSKSVKGFQNHLKSMNINEELVLPPGANRPPDMSVPDVLYEAVNGQTSSLPENTVKGKLDAAKCIEPPVQSSSLCSHGASNNPIYSTLKRRYEDTEGSDCSSDNEEKWERKAVTARNSKGHRKKRTPEVHNLSERRRRDKIKKKLRALQELIPNCNKVDKASMLDEAIEYLQTLQFQVKMMSMGTGGCMPPMMLPTGMQQIHAPQMSHLSPMGMGMRMQMGVGCNPVHFLYPPIPGATAVPGIPETRFQMPGFPGQPLPMSMLRTPSMGQMHNTVPVAGVSRAAASTELMDSAPLTNSKDSIQNVEVNKRNVDRLKIQPSG